MTTSKLYSKVCCLFAKVGALEAKVDTLEGSSVPINTTTIVATSIPEYTDHNAADADAGLALGSFYTLAGSHSLHVKK